MLVLQRSTATSTTIAPTTAKAAAAVAAMNLSSSPDVSSPHGTRKPASNHPAVERLEPPDVTASDQDSPKTPIMKRLLMGKNSSHHSTSSGSNPKIGSPTKQSLIRRITKIGSRDSMSSSGHTLKGGSGHMTLQGGSRHTLDGGSRHTMDGNNRRDTSTRRSEASSIPRLYRHARKCQWDDFVSVCQSSPEDASYVYGKDGTTALHMAIMSRTGYINSFKSSTRDFPEAPMDVIEELLKTYSQAACVPCTLNGYTPLTYACLVCTDTYDVDRMAEMVRLILQYAPDSIQIFTHDGLSPIDIHVVSYSHYHKSKEEDVALGKSSTSVLRQLLMKAPELANLRLRGDKVEGPIEYLYKCNQSAFSEAVMDEMYDSDQEGTMQSDFTVPERRQQVVETVSKWWIWKWAVMIMKYGSLKQKKKGARFAAVHTAAAQVGCPTNLLSITLYAFPRQVKQTLESKDGVHNLPLHLICSWPCHQDYGGTGEAVVSIRKSMAIARVLDEYPEACREKNNRGETPLELALKTGTTWDNGIRRLIRMYPKSLKIQSKQTGLYPFMTAAAAALKFTTEKQDLQSLRTVYGLLRSNPKVLIQCLS